MSVLTWAILTVLDLFSFLGNDDSLWSDRIKSWFGCHPGRLQLGAWILHPFLHHGFSTFVINTLTLWFFGSHLEDRLRTFKFLALVVLGEAAALVTFTAFPYLSPDHEQYGMVYFGSFGMVFAVLGAWLSFVPTLRLKCYYFIWLVVYFHSDTILIPVYVYVPLMILFLDLVGVYNPASAQVMLATLGVGLFYGLMMRLFPKPRKEIEEERRTREEQDQLERQAAWDNFTKALSEGMTETALAVLREEQAKGRNLPLTTELRIELAHQLEKERETYLAAQIYQHLMAGPLDHDQRLEIGLRLANIHLVYNRDFAAAKSLLRTLYNEYKTDPRITRVNELVEKVKDVERNLFKRSQ